MKPINLIWNTALILLMLSLGIASCNARADEWSEGDKWRQGIYTVLHVADWHQTRMIARDRYGERNPILGRYPSVNRVDYYFAGTLAMHYLAAHNLPKEWRKRFQYVTIGVESGAVAHNWSIGYSIIF